MEQEESGMMTSQPGGTFREEVEDQNQSESFRANHLKTPQRVNNELCVCVF